ncbi:hypothetical protein [Alteraurantiacibacter buctensis]|uniref:Uncharacterized protein n=1 Tax=Alteraurantiacibacter buctensis TaxID=1503981 RepID=A0A844YSG5_9SPHN|nr:hypothetical protein [Alteraurantiacibacter buctensis]MXO70489.1 hypothetical protein [Alteraurantiacibacter buctensis]
MNPPTARRTVLRTAAGLSLLPLFASRQALAAGEAATIAPPSGDMIYRRTVVRPLPGAIVLTATRDFRVRFSAREGGFLVDGEQVAARVQAPASLSTIARMEEQRVERGLFPLALDRAGRIVDGEAAAPDVTLGQALDEARRQLPDQGAEIGQLLDALSAGSAGIMAYLPLDLFAPVEEHQEQRQAIELPWGQTGEVVVRFAATRSAETGLMRLATRDVVTKLEGEERRSAERWELFAA